MRAMARRNGRYTSPSAGLIDMPEELSEPMLGALAGQWDKVFSQQIPALLKQHQQSILASVESLVSSFGAEAIKLGEAKKVLMLLPGIKAAAARVTNLQISRVIEEVSKQQMEISREVVPIVSSAMSATFQFMGGMSGTGTRNRMCAALKEGWFEKRLSKWFELL